mgnify:CR=1 FL=1
MYERELDFSTLLGKTLTAVRNIDNEQLIFETTEGKTFKLYHAQDCCESVSIESITGDLADLVGSPILVAEEATSAEHPEGYVTSGYEDSFTWTFYKLATIKGYVDIRWLGSSNGYYSESVDFVEAA